MQISPSQPGHHNRGPRTSHEIELEINPWVLYQHFILKQTAKPNQFDLIITSEFWSGLLHTLRLALWSDFVQILRRWAAFLNTNGTAELLMHKRSTNDNGNNNSMFGADLRDCCPPEEVSVPVPHLPYTYPLPLRRRT